MPNADLNRLVREFRSAIRALLVGWGIARCAAVGLAVLGALVFADFSWRFSAGARFMALAFFIMVAAAGIFFDIVRPLRKKWTDAEVLNQLDRLVSGSRDSFIALSEFSAPGGSVVEARSEPGREILQQAVQDLEKFVKGARLPDIFRPRALRFWQAGAAAAGLLFVLWGVLAPGVL